jgi:hypothetical protein
VYIGCGPVKDHYSLINKTNFKTDSPKRQSKGFRQTKKKTLSLFVIIEYDISRNKEKGGEIIGTHI